MQNEKTTAQPESKFAEVIRKGKEKRRGMQQQSDARAEAELKALSREEPIGADQTIRVDDSEPKSELP